MVTAVVKSLFQDTELILILMRMNQELKAEVSSVGLAPVHCGSRNVLCDKKILVNYFVKKQNSNLVSALCNKIRIVPFVYL